MMPITSQALVSKRQPEVPSLAVFLTVYKVIGLDFFNKFFLFFFVTRFEPENADYEITCEEIMWNAYSLTLMNVSLVINAF